MEYQDLIESLRKNQVETCKYSNAPWEQRFPFWTDGESVMCETESIANTLADFFEACGFGTAVIGYYDPEEDGLNADTDEYTGYWYVTIE